MRELDYTVPGWPDSFYDYMFGMLVMPSPADVSAAYMNEVEVEICANPNAILVRWFDVATSPPEG